MQTFDYSPLENRVSVVLAAKHLYQRSTIHERNFTFFFPVLLAILMAIALVAAWWAGELLSGMSIAMMACFLIFLWICLWQLIEEERRMRIVAFAETNQLDYYWGPLGYQRQGLIFGQGDGRFIDGVLRSPGEGFYEVGNYSYHTGSGKTRHRHTFGFVVIKLPRRLPNIVLDAKKNNFFGITNLPEAVRGNQKLELEGDFNEYFTLYAPRGYERDALYIFTPDIMEQLKREVADYDCEIVGDELFLYRNTHIDLTSRADLQQVISLAASLDKQFEHNADYYSDSRVENRTLNIIAPEGQRLKRALSPLSILAIITYIILILLDLFVRYD